MSAFTYWIRLKMTALPLYTFYVQGSTLFGHTVFNQIDQTVKCLVLVRSVCKQINGGSADDAHGKHAQKALCIYAALVLLHPN